MALKYPWEEDENFPTNMLGVNCLAWPRGGDWSVVLFCVIGVKNYSDIVSHFLASTPQL